MLSLITVKSYSRPILRSQRLVSPLTKSVSSRLYQTPGAKAATREIDFRGFLKEVVEIISSTGVRTGATRTIEAILSFDKLVIDIFRNPSKYQDEKKQISLPKVLKALFVRLGATYVKLGQFIASSPTLFPADFVLEFQSCLDKGPTVPYTVVKKIIEKDLGKPVSSLFKSVDPSPLASASIAQVHRAVLKNGTEVVIKVQYFLLY